MSWENVEIVRSIHVAWERGDFSSAEWAHPDIEYAVADGPTPGSWTGIAGMAEGSRNFLREWEAYRAVAEQYRELDGQRVLVLFHGIARGKTSGLEVRQQGATLWHIRRGKVKRLVFYFDRSAALEAAGLRE